ncbi:hypothetical protein NC653_027801 [Populus alba x Populus x berolinensis]|uniref:Uncharacterized protein n=1 Tax=Populus alba x Populus x berolinensis TaxID=444605 RepID=A0AAD6M6E8_9ROSI|nr:hypothetical protein NC653_027801 [Populus alba x Populus x berolinensis]
MNAVRTLGPAGTYRDIWIYLVAPKLGALVAAATYTIRSSGRKRLVHLVNCRSQEHSCLQRSACRVLILLIIACVSDNVGQYDTCMINIFEDL